MNTDLIDPATVRKFLELLHGRAAAALRGVKRSGVLHLCSRGPADRSPSTSAFNIGDVNHMLEAALIDARAGKNVFVEARTVKPGRPNGRGKIEATIGVFAFVIDNDADRGKAGHVNNDASAVIETSPGNSHVWLFLDHALSAADAKPLGDMIRKASGADHATGVLTQPYRLPGTPNYPDAKKQARGRTTVPTRLISVSDVTWTADELIAAFSTDGVQAASTQPARSVPGSLKSNGRYRSTARPSAAVKRKLAAKVSADIDRSAVFQSAVNTATRIGMSPDQFEKIARKHSDGCAGKYLENGDRLRAEIDRSYAKAEQQQQQEQAQHDAEHAERVATGKSIDGAELLDRVYAFLGQFIAYPSKDAHSAHVLWIAHTHLLECFETTPRLAFLSPEPASGKTRCLELSELLVAHAVPSINCSPAYIIGKIAAEQATLLFDEIDAVFGPKAREGNEDIRALLNAGYRRGATVGRCFTRGSEVIPEELPAFAPVAMAGLGDLPDTIMSRSVVVRMRRRAPNEAVLPYRRREHTEEGQQLHDRLAGWAAAAAGRITVPDMPAAIVDRDADCWEPLIAIADAAGGHWPDTARVSAVALVSVFGEGRETDGIRLLSDLL